MAAPAASVRSTIASRYYDGLAAAVERLNSASHKLAEVIYKETQAQQPPTGTEGAPPPDSSGAPPSQQEEGAVDADFEVVDDDKKEEK